MVRALVLALVLTGCAPRVVYQPIELPLPARPTLPTIRAWAVSCLSDEAYTEIVNRDRARDLYAKQLEAVICTTRQKPCP